MPLRLHSVPGLFLLAALVFFVLPGHGAPVASDPQISIRQLMSIGANAVRLETDPTTTNTLYYSKRDGTVWRVTVNPGVNTSTSAQVYSVNQHGIPSPLGFRIGTNGIFYLMGNEDVATNLTTRMRIVRGVPGTNGTRVWSEVVRTAPYEMGKTAFDHFFGGFALSSNGQHLIASSGSRTDHGEVESNSGNFPGLRETALTALLLKIPITASNLVVQNDLAWLKTNGYVLAEGLRNTFDLAHAPNGDLFGTDNGPDADYPEEINWLREGEHYGFPWRLGGYDNRTTNANYNRTNDTYVNRNWWSYNNVTYEGRPLYDRDTNFPAPPAVTLRDGIINLGPDADKFRGPNDRTMRDASNLGTNIVSMTSHRSPLGIVFDRTLSMAGNYAGDGFYLSWTGGNPAGDSNGGPSSDASQDLVHLDGLTKLTNGSNYSANFRSIVGGFSNPIDSAIVAHRIYVIEYGSPYGLYELTFPAFTNSLVVSTNTVAVPEGGTNTFTVRLASAPASNVTVIITRTSGDTNLTVPSGTNLTFTPANATNAQTIVLAASEDADFANGTAVFTFTAGGINSASVNVSEIDNDTPPPNNPPTITPISNKTTVEDVTTVPIPFVIGDVETPATGLVVTASSDDTNLVPQAGIILAGSDTNRTLTLIPRPDQAGACTITVSVSDGAATTSTTFNLTVTPLDDPPTLTPPASLTLAPSGLSGPLAFFVNDIDTPVGSLTVAAASDNPGLIADTNIVITGTGTNRTVSVTATPGVSGSAVVTLTVSDGTASADGTFTVSVQPSLVVGTNAVPVAEGSTNLVAVWLTAAPTGSVTVTVARTGGDTDLTVQTGASLTFGTNDWAAPQFVTLAAAEDADYATGAATFGVTAPGCYGTGFTATEVENDSPPVNAPPTVSTIDDQSTDEDTPTPSIAFTIGDAETAATDLILSAYSSDTNLVPAAALALAGTGTARTLVITPATNRSGVCTITVACSDGQDTTPRNFTLTVNPVDDVPALTAPASVATLTNTPTAALAFTVSDIDTVVSNLTVTASAANSLMVPPGNFTFGGTGSNRTIIVTPDNSLSGTTTVTLVVSDGTSSASTNFLLTVRPLHALFVMGNAINPGASDSLARTNLESRGFWVTVRSDSNSVPADADAKQLIVLSSTIVSTVVTNKFTSAPVPLLNWETSVQDDLLFTGPTLDTHYGATGATNRLNVLTVAHPITAGLSTGLVTVLNNNSQLITWGRPAASAQNLAAHPSNATLSALYCFERNAPLQNGSPAAARRANMFLHDASFVALNSNGLRLFSNTVTWLLGTNATPAISSLTNLTLPAGTTTDPLPFLVSDAESPATGLVVTATSSDLALLPATNLVLGGTDSNRTLVLIGPAGSPGGTSVVTLAVSDGLNTASTFFSVVIPPPPPNTAPTLTSLTNVTVHVGTDSGPQSFTLFDLETPATGLVVTATSSDTGVLEDAAITLGGSDSNRTLAVTPIGIGTSVVTVVVSDGDLTNSTDFVVTSLPPANIPPTISAIDNLTLLVDSAPVDIPFQVDDAEMSPDDLVLDVWSSNEDLITGGDLVLSGSGTNRLLTLTPLPGQTGVTTITIICYDDVDFTTREFDVTVVAFLNTAPSLSAFTNLTVTAGTNAEPVPFTISDANTPASNLVVTATSSDGVLLPATNLFLSGTDSNRTLVIVAPPSVTGTAIVSVAVSDGELATTNAFDVFIVPPPNTPPWLTGLTNLTLIEGTASDPQPFLVGDSFTPAAQLVVTASADNSDIVPPENLVLGGSDSNRTLVITGALDQTGMVTVTVGVSDGELDTNTTFTLTFLPGPASDHDHDDIPYAWEIAHGMNPDEPDDALMDFDQDGLTNFDEYLAGTDPLNYASVVPALSLGHTGDVSFVTLRTVTNRHYQMQFTPDLWVEWTNVGNSLPGTGTNVTFEFTNSAGQGFHRVLIAP